MKVITAFWGWGMGYFICCISMILDVSESLMRYGVGLCRPMHVSYSMVCRKVHDLLCDLQSL